jgi:hypothetical protein
VTTRPASRFAAKMAARRYHGAGFRPGNLARAHCMPV